MFYYRARWYDPQARRFISEDPIGLAGGINLYAYVRNNPINAIDPQGLQNVYVFDSINPPPDSNVPGTSYQGVVYVVHDDGTIMGPYRGSSYPNSQEMQNGQIVPYSGNILNEGAYYYNNLYGHSGGTQRGLNIVDTNGNRIAPGRNVITGEDVQMTGVNQHAGATDLGTGRSRGSRGCPTIHPDHAGSYLSNFNWENGNRGNSQGVIYIYREMAPYYLFMEAKAKGLVPWLP